MPATTSDKQIVELLEKILKVQAIQVAAGKGITEAARLLKLADLDNQTIAAVLNTTSATVRAVTSNLRTRGR
jgi:hypothetical protein